MTDSDPSTHEDELRAQLRAALERGGQPVRWPAPWGPVEDLVTPADEPTKTVPVRWQPSNTRFHPPTTPWAPTPESTPEPPPSPAEPIATVPTPTIPAEQPSVPEVDEEPPPAPTDVPADEPADVLPYADEEVVALPPSDSQRRLRSGLEWVAVVVGALVVALVVKTFLFQAFYIPSASMEPTLEEGDRVLVNKISYDLHDVNRGDVIVFELDPEDVGPDGIKDLIKRVIGLPGEVIESRDGVVYVDGRALEEPYLADGMLTGDPADGRNPSIERQTVPEGHVFVLGDNRSNSADSRYPYRGPIPIESVVGRAFVLVWPPGDVGTL